MNGKGALTLARAHNWLYLNMELADGGDGALPMPVDVGLSRMAQPVSTPQLPATISPQRRVAQAIVVGGAGLGVTALLGALGLWFHYGTAVFFETITAGISACF